MRNVGCAGAGDRACGNAGGGRGTGRLRRLAHLDALSGLGVERVVVADARLDVDRVTHVRGTAAVGPDHEPFVGASALRNATRRFGLRPRGALVVYLGCAVVLGPFVGGLVGATVGVLFGDGGSFLTVFSTWWLGDVLGVLVVASPILAWARPSRAEKGRTRTSRSGREGPRTPFSAAATATRCPAAVRTR